MNKINIKIVAIIGLLLATTGCRDEFTQELPTTTLALNEAITNEKTLQLAINGLYDQMQTYTFDGRSYSSYGALLPTLQELLADNAFVLEINSNRFSLTRKADLSFYTKDNGDLSTLWRSLYSIIANANFVIEKEGKIADDLNTPGIPNELFAQAHAIRAMAFMTLNSLFAAPQGGPNQNLGVPLPLVFNVSNFLPRSTVDEVNQQILKDLKFAESNINGGKSTYIGNSAVDLLLSRYYLSVRDYPNANIYAELVLNSATSTLLSKADVPNYFTTVGEANKETIFQLEYNGTDSPDANSGITATWGSTGRYKEDFATTKFYNNLGANDVRKNVWYKNTGYVATLPDNPKPIDVVKYVSSDRDIVLLRKTEAVFNQLEALYYTNPTLALSKLNTWMVNYRDSGYSFSGTGSALLNEILQQKNNEFFLEGFRYSDLKRNNIGFTNPQTNVSLNPSLKEFQAFPIPRSEMDTNVNMQQYPDYN